MVVSRCELDAREGGGYDVVFGEPPAGEDYREVAVYEVFEAAPEGTRLHLRDEGLSSQETADGHTEGWRGCFDLVEQAVLAA